MKRKIQEEELAEEEIDLEVGHVGDEEVEIEVDQEMLDNIV